MLTLQMHLNLLVVSELPVVSHDAITSPVIIGPKAK